MKRRPELREGIIGPARFPLLLIGWGREGAKDVGLARNAFRCDKGLDCVDAQGANSEEVLREIASWLKDNPNAQILYIGSHGGEDGLFPTAKAKTRITWAKLASVLSTAKTSITVWLGACSSKFAAEHWSGDPALPVSSIMGFSGETTTGEVMDFLTANVTRSNVVHPGTSLEERELTFLPKDIVDLRKSFPNTTMHYKVDGYGYVDCDTFRKTVGMCLSDYLDSRCNKAEVAQLCGDVLCGLASPDKPIERSKDEEKTNSSCEKLVVRKLKKKERKRSR